MLPIKADKEVTEADRKSYNLVLFGTRQSNTILAQIADKLPVELTPDGLSLRPQQYTARIPTNSACSYAILRPSTRIA